MELKNMNEATEIVRLYREKLLDDPTRPGYHFAVPSGFALPGDPNGAFYARGRYHLMYLYDCPSDSYRWGHLSSADLLNWRSHPDAIIPGEGDGGIFSGGAFVEEDGTVILSYWSLPEKEGEPGGIRLMRSLDRHYDRWEKLPGYAVEATEYGVLTLQKPDGGVRYVACADPSNLWKKDGRYYMQLGNLPVLQKFRKEGNPPPEVKGDWTDLFVSRDLKNWEYLHRFYERDAQNRWTAEDEDDMCPNFFMLPTSPAGGKPSGKYLQLFISHNHGCQYYIGSYDQQGDRFLPEVHGRMSWADNGYFAPEALVDGQGRQIMWAWFGDDLGDEQERGWSGVYGLPRTLWLREDGLLGIAPVEELKRLRSGEQHFPARVLREGECVELPVENGDSCEIRLTIDCAKCRRFGMKVFAALDGGEETLFYYDAEEQALVCDTRRSGPRGRLLKEAAPFLLNQGEKLSLTLYLDRSVAELFANDRQAVARRVYPEKKSSRHILLFCEGGEAALQEAVAWEMMPSNPY
jgi:beta-fructofuranosidase